MPDSKGSNSVLLQPKIFETYRSLEEIERMFVKPSEPRERHDRRVVSRFFSSLISIDKYLGNQSANTVPTELKKNFLFEFNLLENESESHLEATQRAECQ